AARVHHAHRRRGGGVAARGACGTRDQQARIAILTQGGVFTDRKEPTRDCASAARSSILGNERDFPYVAHFGRAGAWCIFLTTSEVCEVAHTSLPIPPSKVQ